MFGDCTATVGSAADRRLCMGHGMVFGFAGKREARMEGFWFRKMLIRRRAKGISIGWNAFFFGRFVYFWRDWRYPCW